MTDSDLAPADRRDIEIAFAAALNSGSSVVRAQAAEVMSRIVAERLVAYLEKSGFVVMRKPTGGGSAPQNPAHNDAMTLK